MYLNRIGQAPTVFARVFCASALVAASLLNATAVSANGQVGGIVEDNGASVRIASSGKLRMLSQQVVAAACYADAGIETEASTAMLVNATAEFLLITAALEFGDVDLGMNGEETDPKTLATLERLHTIWDPIEITAAKVVSGEATSEEITEMALQSEPLLEMAQRLVTAVTAEYSLGASMVLRDAMAIDIAGRQRMLAQRMSKDVCLLANGIDTEHSKEDLAETAQIFEASLFALRDGMPSAGLMAPTDDQVLEDIKVAVADWETIQPKIADALSGEVVDAERLATMFELANTLTADMNDVVVHYTASSKLGS